MPRSYALSDDARAGRVAKKQATREALLDAARTLFAEKGYNGVSVTEIGKKAGVSHTLINSYFGGKAGLIAAVIQGTNAPQADAMRAILGGGGTPVERLFALLNVWAQYDLADRKLLAVLQSNTWVWDASSEAANRADLKPFYAALADLVREARDAGLAQGHIAPADVAEALFAIYTYGTRRALFDPLSPDAAVVAMWPQIEAAAGLLPRRAPEPDQ